MGNEIGLTVGSFGSGSQDQASKHRDRRQERDKRWRAVLVALQASNLVDAKAAFKALQSLESVWVSTDPVLGQIGRALDNGNLHSARRLSHEMQAQREKDGDHLSPATFKTAPEPKRLQLGEVGRVIDFSA